MQVGRLNLAMKRVKSVENYAAYDLELCMTPELAYIVNLGGERDAPIGTIRFNVDKRCEAILAVYAVANVSDCYMGLL